MTHDNSMIGEIAATTGPSVVSEAVSEFVSSVFERMSVLEVQLESCAAASVEHATTRALQDAEKSKTEILNAASNEASQIKSVAEAVMQAAHSEADSLKSTVLAERQSIIETAKSEAEAITAEARAEASRLNDQTLASVERILDEARESAEQTRSQVINERDDLLAEALESQSRAETALDSVRAEAADIIRKAHIEAGSIKAQAHTEAAELRAQADFELRTAQADAEHSERHVHRAQAQDAGLAAPDSEAAIAEAKRRHDNILETANVEAERLKAAAHMESESILAHAKAQAETLIAETLGKAATSNAANAKSDSMDLTQASAILEIDHDSVREAIKDGSLNAIEVEGETRLLYADVISLLKQAVSHSRQEARAEKANREAVERLKAENTEMRARLDRMELAASEPRGATQIDQVDNADNNSKRKTRPSTVVEIVQGVERRPLAEQVHPVQNKPQPAPKPAPSDPRFMVVDVPQKPKGVLSKIALAIWGEP
jgi:hypothetical protein